LLSYVADRLMGKHQVPWSVVRGEVTGYLAGFWGYYQSCQRVKRLGRSAPYVPPEQRSHTGETAPDRWSTTDQRSSFTESR
jgi:O-antigen biosynthesis protein